MIARLTARLRARVERARQRRAMMRAIRVAAEPSEIWGRANLTDGLRAIRAVERLSRRPFDPTDRCLIEVVRGGGPKQRHLRLAGR